MAELKDMLKSWKYRHVPMRGVSDDTYCIDWSDDEEEVAEIVHSEKAARLIAAAPELLVAAQMARLFVTGEALPTKTELLAALECAIAKATGQLKGN